jgi:hypothetical protein
MVLIVKYIFSIVLLDIGKAFRYCILKIIEAEFGSYFGEMYSQVFQREWSVKKTSDTVIDTWLKALITS